jgi:transposase InsO family protein
MYKLTFEKRVWIVKQILKGNAQNTVALAQKVSDRTVREIMTEYAQYGFDALKDHKTGRQETVLNAKIADEILTLRKRYGYGACRIEFVLKNKGFCISHRQIEKLLVRNNLVLPNIKKQKSRKWVRYELPNPNDLWHTDWTYDPFTQKQFSVYIDDKTRLITSFGLFQNATADNSIALLKTGITKYGKPKTIMTDHGASYYNNTPDHKGILQLNTYQIALQAMGIKHYLARQNRPQTNGKVERFFLTYKTEYATGTFTNIKDYIKHHNENRPHMSLGYKTPKQIWDELKAEANS